MNVALLDVSACVGTCIFVSLRKCGKKKKIPNRIFQREDRREGDRKKEDDLSKFR